MGFKVRARVTTRSTPYLGCGREAITFAIRGVAQSQQTKPPTD